MKTIIANIIFHLRNIIFFELRFFYIKYFIQSKYQFPSDLSICITTNKTNWKKTIPPLLNSLLKVGIPENKIYVFEGGHAHTEKLDNYNYNHFKLEHNSFDLTALIAILELNIKSPYWFLLHDTSIVLPNFINQLVLNNYNKFDTLQIKEFPSMNIGIYNGEFLNKNKNFIIEEKNIDYSNVGLQNAKSRGVENEDKVFKLSSNSSIFQRSKFAYQEKDNVIYLGQKRRREVYLDSGIVKYKANFKRSDNYVINL